MINALAALIALAIGLIFIFVSVIFIPSSYHAETICPEKR